MSSFPVPQYRCRDSALHRARPAAAIVFIAGLGLLCFVTSSPIVLGSVGLGVFALLLLSSSLPDVKVFIYVGAMLALLIALVNPLVSHQGLTLLIRGPHLPVLGPLDVTLESLVFGLVMGLRAFLVVVLFGICSVAIDPDRVLTLFRRIGFRSSLTVAMATRFVPLLLRDFSRYEEALRCRPCSSSSTRSKRRKVERYSTLLRALVTGSLERATDTAAALEVRGFGRGKASTSRDPSWSSNDVVFVAVGLAILAVAVLEGALGFFASSFYPTVEIQSGTTTLVFAALIFVLSVAPIAAGWRRSSSGRLEVRRER